MAMHKQQTLINRRLAIAESVIKQCIKDGKIKEAIKYATINKISAERFGELTREVETT